MTAAATSAGMLGGTLTHLALTCWGYLSRGEFSAYEFLGLNPFLWDLVGSALACWLAVKLGPPADQEVITKFFTVPNRSK